ncbi:bifunctional ADP-heptose synthase [uncultured Sunxiuqinia sp.]|uniref:bifunctional heptose 7-phosphate kinase/heptose 1-phosphate adenyltransferase n=1 Tax=uncultured Sunxiuqinia sp. TaxID=1573825 RepID=UPI002627F780|nr:bifunctional ADP-heptose synthase [uncultured Sunxiuqinia sp.]
MEEFKVQEVFTKFSNMRALVVGDAMVDSYLWGCVDRISAEAPVPIVTVQQREDRIGGAGNVSLNLQSLGATPVLVSLVGNDLKGDNFMQLLREKGLSGTGILRLDNRQTTVKTRVMSGKKQVLRVDEEVTEEIDSEVEKLVYQRIEQLINSQKFDLVMFIDYDKGMITSSLIDKIICLAQTKKLLIAVDPKKRNFNNYSGVHLFKPNFKEFKEGQGVPVEKDNIPGLLEAAEAFRKSSKQGMIFVTLSDSGVIISNGQNQDHFPAEVRDIADVSGAGDTVIAVASLCMAAGMSSQFVAQLSNLAGGLVCERSGVVPIDQEQLMREAQRMEMAP